MRGKGTDHWPPSTVAAMIADMEHDLSSPHWMHADRYIRTYARRLVHPGLGYRFEPDDLAQEVMITLMASHTLASFRGLPLTPSTSMSGVTPETVFLKFLNVIIRRKFKDMLRPVTADAKHRAKGIPGNESESSEVNDPLEQVPSAYPTVERQVETLEELDDVYHALRRLAARNRSTARNVAKLWHSVFTGEDYKHIAERFDCDPDAVRLDIFRIREKLRRAIATEEPPAARRKRAGKAAPISRDGAPRNTSRRARQSAHALSTHVVLEQPLRPTSKSERASPPLRIPDVLQSPDTSGEGHLPSADVKPSPEPMPIEKHRKGQSHA